MDFELDFQESSVAFNSPVFGFFGSYTLTAGVVVPYVSCTLDLERVVKEIKTYDQLPPNLQTTWSLSELYQREIDYDRIEKELVNGYLKDPHKIKFFNAITVVLFPRDKEGRIAASYDDTVVAEPKIPVDGEPIDKNFESADTVRKMFGGVQYAKRGVFARLRWDERSVVAVAVDGQHRVCALRKWYEHLNNTLTDEQKKTRIPIIFLVLHRAAGFQSGGSFESIRQIAREVFTDLNKNAKKVDDAREIILDDKSLEALCARRLVTEATSQDDPKLLPLSLVRWQEPNPRFDQGYYLNSLVHLRQIVQIALSLAQVSDPMDKEQCDKYIVSLDVAVGSPTPSNGDQKLTHDGVALEAYYSQNYVSDEVAVRPLLHLPASYLEAAVKGFETYHKDYLLSFLVGFKPYKELLSYARSNGLIEGFFSQWNSQPTDHKRQLRGRLEQEEEHWERNRINVHVESIMGIKGKGPQSEHWGFKNIFQKACVRLLRTVAFTHAKSSETVGTASDVVNFLDNLYDRDLLRVRRDLAGPYKLWTFIALHASGEGRIKVSVKTENALYNVLLLAYYMNRKAHVDALKGVAPEGYDVGRMMTYFRSERSNDEVPIKLWPACRDAHNHLISLFEQHANVIQPDLDGLEGPARAKKKETIARDRLVAVMRALAVTFEPTQTNGD